MGAMAVSSSACAPVAAAMGAEAVSSSATAQVVAAMGQWVHSMTPYPASVLSIRLCLSSVQLGASLTSSFRAHAWVQRALELLNQW